jgi:hypothetical protein
MNFSKYPRTKAMMEKTGWTLDELYEWTEKQLEGEGKYGKQQ